MKAAILAFFFLILFAEISLGQEVLCLEGRVIDSQTGLPVPHAQLELTGSPYSATSDQDGHFAFFSLPETRYTLRVSRIGYQSRQVGEITVSAHAPLKLQIDIAPQPLFLPELLVQTSPLPSSGALSGARLISESQIRRAQSNSLAELLQKEGLADLISDGSPGGSKTVSIRGSSSEQVAVLLDGYPLNEAASGLADLSRIAMSEVAQIEVYPQASSGLEAGAIGGVVNVITKKPGANSLTMQAKASSYGEKHGSLSVGRSVGGWPLWAMIEHHESPGEYRYRVVPDDGLDYYARAVGSTNTRQNAAFRRDYFVFKAHTPIGMDVTMRRSLLHRQNPDYLPLPILTHSSTTDDQRAEMAVDFLARDSWYRPALKLKAEAYQQTTITDYGSQYPLLYDHAHLRGEAYSAQFAWHRALDWRDIAYGIGLRWERLHSSELATEEADRLHRFGYLQVQGDPFAPWQWPISVGLYAGLRCDLYSSQKPQIHPKLGLEFSNRHADLSWSLRAEFAGAYHLPSFNALFWQEDLQSRGNPLLKPEHSLNREISGMLQARRWQISASYFYREVWDLIYWRLDFDNKWKPLNLYSAQIDGSESSLRATTGSGPWNLEISLQHHWLRAINHSGEPNTEGMILPYRPSHTILWQARQDVRAFVWEISGRWVGRRYTNEANTKALSDYTVWDASLARSFGVGAASAQITVQAEVRNAFNVGYRLVDAAPMPMRELWLTISFNRDSDTGE